MNEIKRPCPICGQETEGKGISSFDKKLNECPFCGSKYVQLFTVPSEDGVSFIAGCTFCGARTRECIDYEYAIGLWNSRPSAPFDPFNPRGTNNE